MRLGPKFNYLPEGSKSWLIVKEKVVQKAQSVFNDTNIKITTEGKQHFVAGSETFKQKFVLEKTEKWIK